MSDTREESRDGSESDGTESPAEAAKPEGDVSEAGAPVEKPTASDDSDADDSDADDSDADDSDADDSDTQAPPEGAEPREAEASEPGKAPAADPLKHPEHLKTARMFAEIAVESGPDGDLDPSDDRSRAALVLLSESLFWVRRAVAGESDADAATWLSGLDEALLERVSSDAKVLTGATNALRYDPRGGEKIDVTDLEALQRVARGLIHELEAPARAAERQKALRLTKIATAVLVGVVALVAGIWALVVPPDLAVNAKLTTSSSLKPCIEPTDCGSAVFHTRLQNNPWAIYDLGAEHDLSLVKIQNRSDCCYERAVPLLLETSSDGKKWTEQTRRREVFLNWEAELNVRARYVRLRVPRQTYLHLGSVVIR